MFLQHASPEAQVKTLRSNVIGLLLNPGGPLNLRELGQSPMPLGFSDQGTQVREEIPTTLKNRLWPKKSLAVYRILIIV